MNMTKYLIRFEDLEWTSPKKGVDEKLYSDGNKRMRLVRFNEDFIEEDWCLKGHVGLVLDGEMTIDFNGTTQAYKKGDGLWIREGRSSKHKVVMEKGKYVELILFESEV